jgi:hypothetical protein
MALSLLPQVVIHIGCTPLPFLNVIAIVLGLWVALRALALSNAGVPRNIFSSWWTVLFLLSAGSALSQVPAC